MKTISPLVILLMLGLSTAALAHTRLSTSNPADGAEIAAPSDIRLEFSAPVRLTAVKLESASGSEVELGDIPADVAASFSVAIDEPLAAGAYVVTWRSISGDTHVVSGEFRFTVTE